MQRPWKCLRKHSYLAYSSLPRCSVAQSCLTLCDPRDCGQWCSSVHGILQAGILEWVAVSSSTESSQPRDGTRVSCFDRRTLYYWATWKGPYSALFSLKFCLCSHSCRKNKYYEFTYTARNTALRRFYCWFYKRYQQYVWKVSFPVLHRCSRVLVFMFFLCSASVCSPKILFPRHQKMIRDCKRNLRKWLKSCSSRKPLWVSRETQGVLGAHVCACGLVCQLTPASWGPRLRSSVSLPGRRHGSLQETWHSHRWAAMLN